MRPSRRMSSRSRASASRAAISSPRLGRASVSEGTLWGDMKLLQKLPGNSLSRNFSGPAQDKDGGGPPSSSRRRPGPIATGRGFCKRSLIPSFNEKPRRLGPGVRRDDRLLNPPPRPYPIGIAQAPLENLAGILAWQLGLDFDVFWHLVVGQRHLELGPDRADIQPHPCLRFHHPHQRLAEFFVGNAEPRAVVHPGHSM